MTPFQASVQAHNARVNDAIERLGIDLLRELRAICWFCDAGLDGKYALIPSDRRHWYAPGGQMGLLVELGCVRLLTPTYCATIQQHSPALRMEHFGRNVLLRARALRLDLEPPAEDAA